MNEKPISFKVKKPSQQPTQPVPPAEQEEKIQNQAEQVPVNTPEPKKEVPPEPTLEERKRPKPEEPKKEVSIADNKSTGVKGQLVGGDSVDDFPSYWDKNVGVDRLDNVPDVVISEEEQVRSGKIAGQEKNDASKVIAMHLGSENELVKAFETIRAYTEQYKNFTQEDLEANPELKATVEWWSKLKTIVDASMHTDQQSLMMQMIDALNKHNHYLEKLDKRLSITKMSSDLSNSGQPRLLSGDAAMQLVQDRYRGLYRIQLHNSGFWVKIMPPRSRDIRAWLDEVDFERKQFGRIIGGHFHLGSNIFLKQKLADLVRMTVVDSNLEDWKSGSNLVDSISIHDYDTLCWAYSTMIYKDGVSVSTVCVNPDCKNHNKAQFMDLARLSYINPDIYTKEAMQFMIEGTAPGVIRKQKDIKYYKENLLKNVRVITSMNKDQYELKDPSLGEFIRIGTDFLGKLASYVKDGDTDSYTTALRKMAMFHLSKMYSAWISKIIIKNDNGSIAGIITDRDAITASLESIVEDDKNIIKNIEEFITNSKVSYYTATSMRCPKCGHQPNLLKDNIFPLDVEYVLFCLFYLRLDQVEGGL